MLDIAWPELVVIGAVALVAIPPKDLPKAMHTLGVWAGKVRRIMQDVRGTVEQLSYEAEIAQKLHTPNQDGPTKAPEAPTLEKDHEREHVPHPDP